MDEIGKTKLREFESRFGEEIDNWRRWVLLRDWLPPSIGSVIGSRYQSKNRETEKVEIREAVDLKSAVKLERIVSAMPDQHRQAFVLQYIGRVAIRGRMRFAKTKGDCIRVMGVSRKKYYALLFIATTIINRELSRH